MRRCDDCDLRSVREAVDEPQARPHVVDRAHLVVDEPAREPDLAHVALARGRSRHPRCASATRPRDRRRSAAPRRAAGSDASSSRAARRRRTRRRRDSSAAACSMRTPGGQRRRARVRNPSGAPTNATRDPSLMPSFFGSTVPEYPATVGVNRAHDALVNCWSRHVAASRALRRRASGELRVRAAAMHADARRGTARRRSRPR